jgi:SH3 domain protein
VRLIITQAFSSILLLFASSLALAERVAYVTDNLSTAVRSGTSTEYRILFYVPAGAAITVLDEPAENGYIKVRDEKGREGWTLERFITNTKGARIRLAETQQQLSEALLEIENLKKQHQSEIKALTARLNAANEIVEKSKTFQQQLSELQTRNTVLEQQNRRLADRFQQEVFFAGAIVVIAGAIIGIFIGRYARKKRSAWN